jgi:hypothetical protein
LTPLAAFLGEVAKAFPNEFPRNLDRMKVRALGSRLGEATDPLLLDAPAPAQRPEEVSQSVPGASAPRSDIYEQVGPRGRQIGEQADATRDESLPPSPARARRRVRPVAHKKPAIA